MEWTKVPTDLLTDALQDWELAAILKYQLLFALKEENPSDVVARRYLTSRQLTFIRQYIDSISARVQQDIDTCNKDRKRKKEKYNKINNNGSFSPQRVAGDSEEPLTVDKIRRDNKKIHKKSFGEFQKVLLTGDELEKLKTKYGGMVEMAVDKLDAYIASTGKKYKDHYAVLKENGWVWNDVMGKTHQSKIKIEEGKPWLKY